MIKLQELSPKTLEQFEFPKARHEDFTWVQTRLLPQFAAEIQEQSQALSIPQAQGQCQELPQDFESDPLAFAALCALSSNHHLDFPQGSPLLEQKIPAGKHLIHLDLAAGQEAEVVFELAEHAQLLLSTSQGAASKLKIRMLSQNSKLSLAHIHAEIAEDAQFHALDLSLGNSFYRSSWRIHLNGERADAKLRTLSLGHEQDRSHHHVRIHHHAAQSTSDQIAAQVLGGSSEASFDGTVHVDRIAQESNSSQIIRSLLLSDQAKSHSKPNLQIHADNVKCAHGNTCGELENSELFYLQSRGLSLGQAKEILTLGFCETVLEDLAQDQAKAKLHQAIATSLADAKGESK